MTRVDRTPVAGTKLRMVHTHGWVRRKVKNSDKWVRRWLEVNKHVLYSYQSCPADMPSARVMNMLDLRKTRTIDVVDGEEGLFVIVPQSAAVWKSTVLRWCGGRRNESARTCRKILISTQVRGRRPSRLPDEGGVARVGARLGRGTERGAGPRDREERSWYGAPAGARLLLALLRFQKSAGARPARPVLESRRA